MNELNKAQYEAVTTTEGYVRVIAGASSTIHQSQLGKLLDLLAKKHEEDNWKILE